MARGFRLQTRSHCGDPTYACIAAGYSSSMRSIGARSQFTSNSPHDEMLATFHELMPLRNSEAYGPFVHSYLFQAGVFKEEDPSPGAHNSDPSHAETNPKP